MVTKKTKQNPTLLKAALIDFRAKNSDFSPEAIIVLDRLGKSRRAAEAFTKLGLDERSAASILYACLQAEQLLRTFYDLIKVEREMLGDKGKRGRLERLEHAVTDLRHFVSELNCKPEDLLAARTPRDLIVMRAGLDELDSALTARRRTANETLPRLGATRKRTLPRLGVTRKRGDTANETAAIGWIGDSVRRCCGRPHTKATAVLAKVALNCVVTHFRLNEAARTRQQREWRTPL